MEGSSSGAAGQAGGTDLDIRVEHALGLFVLAPGNEGSRLGAARRAAILEALERQGRDPLVYCGLVRSAVAGAFLDDGDPRPKAEQEAGGERLPEVRAALGDIWRMDRHVKPVAALIDGPLGGTAAGFVQAMVHKVACEHYRLMPFGRGASFLDTLGLAHPLARAGVGMGRLLALTGRPVGRADAVGLGLATMAIDAGETATIEAALADADPIDPVLDARARPVGEGPLTRLTGMIEETLGAPSVGEGIARLRAVGGPLAGEAAAIAGEIEARGVIERSLVWRLVGEAASGDLRSALRLEYRVQAWCAAHGGRQAARTAEAERIAAEVLGSPAEGGELDLPDLNVAPAAIG
ncbi:MAG: enoyl-CoA hydratase/isomerase family protein [Hyphomicrobiaceae bacterium]